MLEALRGILVQSEPLLLFVVIGLGYLVGQAKWRGFGLGISGVLFVGLAFGAWDVDGQPPLQVAPMVREVGLILFVYAVGLTSGPGFFSALRQHGLKFNAAIVVALVTGAGAALATGLALGLSPGLIAGAYCGGLTNTPALAATTELLRNMTAGAAMQPTLGYSLTYPYGVLGGLIGLQLFTLATRRHFTAEKAASQQAAAAKALARNFEVTNPALFGKTLTELAIHETRGLVLSRVRHAGEVVVPTRDTRLHQGDVVVAEGREEDLDQAEEYFGRRSTEELERLRAPVDMRRILMSNKRLVGKTIASLNLDRRFNGQITRLRRADIDMAPAPDMRLDLGDRLRVVAPRDRIADLSAYFGDSEKHVAELDYTALTLGISLGVLVGMIPIPVPGSGNVTLGFAGGPLLVALVLGRLGRTGRIVWSIPLEANLALRHLGLLFFLAGVGVTAGSRFEEAFAHSGWQLLLLGLVITTLTTALAMVLLRFAARGTVIGTLGATTGMQTQPATLARAHEMARSEEIYTAYATVFPVAMVGKIIIAQLIVMAGYLLI